MKDCRQPFRHLRVPTIRFTWDSAEQVPRGINTELERPLQELYVDERRVSLGYQCEHVVVETFDAGLDPSYAGPRQKLDLLALQVSLGLIEQRVLLRRVRQLRQYGLEERHVEDVVDKLDVPDSIAPLKL